LIGANLEVELVARTVTSRDVRHYRNLEDTSTLFKEHWGMEIFARILLMPTS